MYINVLTVKGKPPLLCSFPQTFENLPDDGQNGRNV